MTKNEIPTFSVSAESLAKALAFEHALIATCLLIYLIATVIVNRCKRCSVYLDNLTNNHNNNSNNILYQSGPNVAALGATFVPTHQRRLIKQTKPQAVALAAIVACTVSLLLRVIPAFYPSVSLLDARNVIFAGSSSLIYTLGAEYPAQVRILFLYNLLADILLLSAIWLALSRQAFTLHDVFRNGGHTLVSGHYWRIFSPIAGWSCVVVAVIAIPCTELLVFLLFDRYVTSTMGFQAIAQPVPFNHPSQSLLRVETADQTSNTGSMITTGTGWALARIVIGIWCIAYSIAGFIIAQATFRRRAEMFSRRNQATPASHLALSLPDNCRVFVHLFALPLIAFAFALLASIQAGFVLWHEPGGNWQLVFTSISSAIVFLMYLLLICSLSVNVYPSRPLSALTSSGMTAVAYGANRSQTFHGNPDLLCQQQMDDVNTHMQQLYSSGLSLPPLIDSAEATENTNNLTSNPPITADNQPRDTVLTISPDGIASNSNSNSSSNDMSSSINEQHKRMEHRTIERGLSGSIASLMDILPNIPRRLIYNSAAGRRMQSNETIRRLNNSDNSASSAHLTGRRRSLSLPSMPILPSHDTPGNTSLAPALHKIRSSPGINGNAYIENYRHSIASPTFPDNIHHLHSQNYMVYTSSDPSSSTNYDAVHPSHHELARSENTTQSNVPTGRPLHTSGERATRFKWPSISSISAMVATATGRHQRSSIEQSPVQPEFTRASNEQMSSPLIDGTSPNYLESGRHANDNQYMHSHAISHANSSQPHEYTSNHEIAITNNVGGSDDTNENQQLEPFSFVVLPPVQRRVRSTNHMSSRSFPSHKHTLSSHTPQHTSITNAVRHSRARQASLPSLPRMEAFGMRPDTESILLLSPSVTTNFELNRAIPGQLDNLMARTTQPRSPTRVTFAGYSNNNNDDDDEDAFTPGVQLQPTIMARRRIDLGSYGGLDLGPFGNGNVNERSDEDDSITEEITLS